VYLFEVYNSMSWSQSGKLVVRDGAIGDRMGFSVAIYDHVLAVGSYTDDDRGASSGISCHSYIHILN
jgi:hypothetical protein